MVLLRMPHSFFVLTTPLTTNPPQSHVKCKSLMIGPQEKRKQRRTQYKQTRIKCKQTRKSQKIFPPCSVKSFLACSNGSAICVKNLEKLITEIYMSLNNINPSIIQEFHEKKDVAFDLRRNNLCKLLKAKTTSY